MLSYILFYMVRKTPLYACSHLFHPWHISQLTTPPPPPLSVITPTTWPQVITPSPSTTTSLLRQNSFLIFYATPRPQISVPLNVLVILHKRLNSNCDWKATLYFVPCTCILVVYWAISNLFAVVFSLKRGCQHVFGFQVLVVKFELQNYY